MSPPRNPSKPEGLPSGRPQTAGYSRRTNTDEKDDEEEEDEYQGDDFDEGYDDDSEDPEKAALKNKVALLQAKLRKGKGKKKKHSKAGKRLRAAKKAQFMLNDRTSSAVDGEHDSSRSPSPPRATRASRPTSAPGARTRKVKQVSKRLYDSNAMGGVYERLREAARSPESMVDLQSNPDNSSPRPESGIASSGNPKAKNYTYDMKSGRRIYMTAEEVAAVERRRELYMKQSAEELKINDLVT